jgi:hypothetical protein
MGVLDKNKIVPIPEYIHMVRVETKNIVQSEKGKTKKVCLQISIHYRIEIYLKF